ncbi:MAG TPA: hypothetical protein VLA45_03015 [Paracoccaceae bacterium]|nr:hypothetical protein [Paracoccaceae bacterium]
MLTGFRAFPGVPDNPTQALVDHFRCNPGLLPDAALLALLDVDYRTVGPAIDALLAHAPAALVLTGYSGRAKGITLEAQASALCAADQPDAAGFVALPEPSPILSTTIDLVRLQSVIAHHAPCALSQDAGQYLCNFSYRHALDRVTAQRLPTQVLFVHVPAISGTPLAETAAASLPLDLMAAALAQIARELAVGP